MKHESEAEDLRLLFARQLYARCLEQHGKDHPETRLVAKYIATFRPAPLPPPTPFQHMLVLQ